MKNSWIHSFCVAKQREMSVSVNLRCDTTVLLEVAICDLQFRTNEINITSKSAGNEIGKQLMLSHDLAELYQVGTKVLNQQVRRIIGKLPESYMFQLTQDEHGRLS